MEAVYLRHISGTSLGPLTKQALEVLFDARVIDESTWVSADGEEYRPLSEQATLLEQLRTTKSQLDHGEDPWPDRISVRAPLPPPKAGGENGDGPPATTLAWLVDLAVKRAQGVLRLPTPDGEVRLSYRDGKIVIVEANDPALSLSTWMVDEHLVTPSQIAEAEEKAPSIGTDLGGALVGAGVISPSIYFEKLRLWATTTIGRCMLRSFTNGGFDLQDVSPPTVPLGFDRFGLLFESLRQVADRKTLELRLLEKRGCPLIPSHIEGVSLEDTKPKPRELRALNAINGVLTLGDVLDQLGGSGDDRTRDVLRAILFATEAGFVIFGQDPIVEKELADARLLEQEYREFRKLNWFELLRVSETSSDEDVRRQYTELAKKYHPNRIRHGAEVSLREANERLFAIINEAFGALETSDQRYQYAHDLEAGRAGAADRAHTEAGIEADTYFKKAEILLRMKKYDAAVDQVSDALKRTPSNREFQVFRAYASYLSEYRRGGGEDSVRNAMKAISGIMQYDASIARGYLYLGYLNKALKKDDVSTKYFKKVLELEPAHPEATREVRVAAARKDRKDKKKRWGL